jgi:hypothetical protein
MHSFFIAVFSPNQYYTLFLSHMHPAMSLLIMGLHGWDLLIVQRSCGLASSSRNQIPIDVVLFIQFCAGDHSYSSAVTKKPL